MTVVVLPRRRSFRQCLGRVRLALVHLPSEIKNSVFDLLRVRLGIQVSLHHVDEELVLLHFFFKLCIFIIQYFDLFACFVN